VASGPIDIAHLTFRPPFAPGSYNRMVGDQMARLRQYRHVAISYWSGDVPPGSQDGSLQLVNEAALPRWRKVSLNMPERLRQILCHGIGEPRNVAYAWEALRLLPELKPKIIVCYDGYKLGQLLRPHITWPSRLVLSQRGLSYFLNSRDAARVYRLNAFDVIWSLTYASYRYDRRRMVSYEPLVKVLPNSVDTDVFRPASHAERDALRASWQLPIDGRVVLLLSRLVPKKGAHLILHSWPRILREVPDAFLWIVGGGDARYIEYLNRMIGSLGVGSSVRLEGAVAPDATPACYRAANLYAFPTVFVEGQSRSLLEAMASGLACVSSDHDVAREAYDDSEVRFVSDPNVEDAFVAPIVGMLTNADARERMGDRARSAVVNRYSYRVNFEQIAQFYHRQLELARATT
jgi:glycosyltransferase involved in cell wall biosynthesis